MADSLSGASAPVVVSESAAGTVSADAQSLYPTMTGDSWADYESTTPAAAPEQPAEGSESADEGSDRPRNPDGTFKAKETDEAAPVGDEPVEGEQEVEAEAPEVEPEPEPFLVKIPGREKGEPDLEIPFAGLTEDQQEGLNRLRNGYMRGEDARAKTASLDAKLAELNEFETMLTTNPEHVILKALPQDKQVSIAVKLIAQHWDSIVPAIQQMDQDPVERIKTASRAEIELRDNQKLYEQRLAATRAAQTVRAALLATIPEGTPDHIAESFYDDAVRDIQRAEERGATITTQNLPALLEQRVKLYGFASAKPSTTPAPATPVARAIARPVAAAAPVAQPPQSAADAALQQARTGQARLSQTITAQRRAASVPPAGAGAAPVKLPPIPKDADIETASRALKKAGRSWANI